VKRFVSFLFVLVISISFASDYPLSVTDDLGNKVILEKAPQRIVSMIPSATETVCALNACDLLVGRDEYSNYPGSVNDVPAMGNGFTPNLEAIVASEPDLVIIDESGDLAKQLIELGIPVYAGTAQTFDGVFEKISTIGLIIDREKEAAFLNLKLKSGLANVHARIAGLPAPTVYYELDSSPYSVGPGSFIGEILSLAGSENIVTKELGNFPKLDPEFIVAANPDIILLADAQWGESAETLASRAGWSALSAIVNKRVIELSQDEVDKINRPGPRIVEALQLLVKIFHPDIIE